MGTSDAFQAPGPAQAASAILIVSAGRGLGHALAEEFVKKDWHVIGMVRPGARGTKLHDLADAASGQVEIETLDINEVFSAVLNRSRGA